MPVENSKRAKADVFVLKGRVRVNQPESGGLRTSLDSVMVAAACPARAGDHLLDLGCGVGAAGLCVLARAPGIRLTGVDIDPDLVALAQGNAQANDQSDVSTFFVADVTEKSFWQGGPPVDHVVCNPPYLDAGTYTESPDQERAKALGHPNPSADLGVWLRAAHRALKSKGTLTLIHRADYLDQIFEGLGRRFGDIQVIPLWPRVGQPAGRVIVRALKDRRGPMTLCPGIVLHEGQGWAQSARDVLEDMAAI